MQNILKLNTIIFLALIVVLGACKKEKNYAKPEIKKLELGAKNNKKAEAGEDLHIEVEIVADAKIDRIRLVIHPEGMHHKKGSLKRVAWKVDTVFTDFKGLKNSTFHQHIDVPIDAELGDYHFHFSVIDMEGQVTEVQEELVVIESDGQKNNDYH